MLSTAQKILLIGFAAMVSAALLTSCGSTFMVAADDVYGTVPTREQERRMKLENQWRQSQNTQEADNSDSYSYSYSEEPAPTDTFNYDNYYDYEYSSRLRRFQNDDFVSDDYYSDYYTNSYWYDQNPNSYGTSIYLGYDWWYPGYTYYRPGWYMGFSYGPFSFGYGSYWRSYYWPYYAWDYGWGYGSYGHGYWNGYWDGYWDGRYGHCYDYCYNPYDRNTYTQSYYGRRTRSSSATNPSVIANNAVRRESGSTVSSATGTVQPSLPTRRTFAERYEQAISSEAASSLSKADVSVRRSNTNTTSNTNTGITTTERRFTGTPSSMMESVSARLDKKVVNSVTPVAPRPQTPVRRTTATSASGTTQRVNTTQGQIPVQTLPATPRNTQTTPERRSVNAPRSTQTSQPRSYSTPVYDRSRSSSSYVSPRYNASPRTTPVARPANTTAPRSTTTTARPATTVRSTSTPRSTSGSTTHSSGSSSGSTPVRRTR